MNSATSVSKNLGSISANSATIVGFNCSSFSRAFVIRSLTAAILVSTASLFDYPRLASCLVGEPIIFSYELGVKGPVSPPKTPRSEYWVSWANPTSSFLAVDHRTLTLFSKY